MSALTEDRAGGAIVRTTDLLIEPSVAVIVVEALMLTTAGVKLYEPLVAPAATVTIVPAGMVVPSELDSPTTTPLGPALPDRNTVAVAVLPP